MAPILNFNRLQDQTSMIVSPFIKLDNETVTAPSTIESKNITTMSSSQAFQPQEITPAQYRQQEANKALVRWLDQMMGLMVGMSIILVLFWLILRHRARSRANEGIMINDNEHNQTGEDVPLKPLQLDCDGTGRNGLSRWLRPGEEGYDTDEYEGKAERNRVQLIWEIILRDLERKGEQVTWESILKDPGSKREQQKFSDEHERTQRENGEDTRSGAGACSCMYIEGPFSGTQTVADGRCGMFCEWS